MEKIMTLLANIASVFGLLTLVIGVLSYIKKNKIQEVESLMLLHKFYLDDKEMIEIFNKLEWSSGKEGLNFTEKDLKEHSYKMEKFFSFFEYVLILKEKKLVSGENAYVYDYMLQRVVSHPTIKEYFKITLLPHIEKIKSTNPYPKLSLLIKN